MSELQGTKWLWKHLSPSYFIIPMFFATNMEDARYHLSTLFEWSNWTHELGSFADVVMFVPENTHDWEGKINWWKLYWSGLELTIFQQHLRRISHLLRKLFKPLKVQIDKIWLATSYTIRDIMILYMTGMCYLVPSSILGGHVICANDCCAAIWCSCTRVCLT